MVRKLRKVKIIARNVQMKVKNGLKAIFKMTKIIFYLKENNKWREHQTMELNNFSDEEIQKNIKINLEEYKKRGYEAKAEQIK